MVCYDSTSPQERSSLGIGEKAWESGGSPCWGEVVRACGCGAYVCSERGRWSVRYWCSGRSIFYFAL